MWLGILLVRLIFFGLGLFILYWIAKQLFGKQECKDCDDDQSKEEQQPNS